MLPVCIAHQLQTGMEMFVYCKRSKIHSNYYIVYYAVFMSSDDRTKHYYGMSGDARRTRILSFCLLKFSFEFTHLHPHLKSY